MTHRVLEIITALLSSVEKQSIINAYHFSYLFIHVEGKTTYVNINVLFLLDRGCDELDLDMFKQTSKRMENLIQIHYDQKHNKISV